MVSNKTSENCKCENNCCSDSVVVGTDYYPNYYTVTTTTAHTYNPSQRESDEKLSGKFKYLFESGGLCGASTVYIKEIIYNDPATIVLWSDGSKTVSKCAEGDVYNYETGLAVCVLKKLVGGVKVHDLFEDWLPTSGNRVTLKQVRQKHRK